MVANGRCLFASMASITSGTRRPRTTTQEKKTAVYGPPRSCAAAQLARVARGREAEEHEGDQDELGDDGDGVPAHERLPLRSRRVAGEGGARRPSRCRRRGRAARGRRCSRGCATASSRGGGRCRSRGATPIATLVTRIAAAPAVRPSEERLEEPRQRAGRLPAEPAALLVVQRPEAEEEADRVDEDEDPGAPRHRRGGVEEEVEAPGPEPVGEVEPEGEHADARGAPSAAKGIRRRAAPRGFSPDFSSSAAARTKMPATRPPRKR